MPDVHWRDYARWEILIVCMLLLSWKQRWRVDNDCSSYLDADLFTCSFPTNLIFIIPPNSFTCSNQYTSRNFLFSFRFNSWIRTNFGFLSYSNRRRNFLSNKKKTELNKLKNRTVFHLQLKIIWTIVSAMKEKKMMITLNTRSTCVSNSYK